MGEKNRDAAVDGPGSVDRDDGTLEGRHGSDADPDGAPDGEHGDETTSAADGSSHGTSAAAGDDATNDADAEAAADGDATSNGADAEADADATTTGTDPEAYADGDDAEEGDDDLAAEVVAVLTASGATVAVAESLTGGLVCAAITDVPGASAVLRGGIVAYATELKTELLGVSPVLLASAGPVHPVVASMMATAVRDRLGATYGVATTGVAGPDTQRDRPVGTVYIAVEGPDGSSVERHQLPGDRADIRDASVAAALRLLLTEASPRAAR